MNKLRNCLLAIALVSGLLACGGGNDGAYIYVYEDAEGYSTNASSVYINGSLQKYLASKGVTILSIDDCLGISESNGEFPLIARPLVLGPPRVAEPEAPYMYFAYRVVDDAAFHTVIEEKGLPPGDRNRTFRDTPLSATSRANSKPIPCGT